MGRHKDTDTLNFIEWLRTKGIDLGYDSEIEYPIGQNYYYVDVVWKYGQRQIPVITFEVETTNCSGIFKNTMKIFGTQKSLVRKPSHHFMIILKGSLTEGQKASLHIFLDHFNISLYENILNEPYKQEELENELSQYNFRAHAREENTFLSSFRENILLGINDIEYAFFQFGYELPFLLKGEYVLLGEKHAYEKISQIISNLKNRLHKITSANDVQREDFEIFMELIKLAERIDAKESVLLSQGICPKCGSKLTQKQISHGGTEYDPEPYAVTYIDGCESCDYELNRETIML